MLATTRTNEAI